MIQVFVNQQRMDYEIVFDEVNNVGEWAFAYCDSLRKISLPKCLNLIKLNGFRYCHNLAYIELKNDTMVTFENNAFYSTSEDKRFFVPYSAYNNYLKSDIWREYCKRIQATD